MSRLLSAFVVLSALLSTPSAGYAELRDGKRFDPAASMQERATGAPEQLDAVAWMVGHWRVSYTRHVTPDSSWTASGRADITWMNRGHNLMERFHCDDFDGQGHELNTLSFLVYNAANQLWGWGVADSWRESITTYSGRMDGNSLVLRHAARRGGNLTLTHYRLTITSAGNDAFTLLLQSSTDAESYADRITARYDRLSDDDGLFTQAEGLGEAAPGLPKEARQFDFLLGEWDFQHNMTFPNGQSAQWPAYGTAVMMMNGHCIMEYSSYDIDPRLPDAATTIVRLYNRQMRRWENMYTTNRFNGILYFGGALEDDQIVLHQFSADTGDVPMNEWVFHSWKDGSYGWYANTSNDRGATWSKTWIIDATQR